MTWDDKGMGLAWHVATWSKDPSTQVGCAIFDEEHRVMAIGYNGFPRGIKDDERLNDRAEKYPRVVHSELNALLNGGIGGHTLYCTMFPCADCAGPIIQAGIKRVVCGQAIKGWTESSLIASEMFRESHVEYIYYTKQPASFDELSEDLHQAENRLQEYYSR